MLSPETWAATAPDGLNWPQRQSNPHRQLDSSPPLRSISVIDIVADRLRVQHDLAAAAWGLGVQQLAVPRALRLAQPQLAGMA